VYRFGNSGKKQWKIKHKIFWWWGWEDSNFQPNDYQLLAGEVPEVARLCVRAPGLCKKPIEFQ